MLILSMTTSRSKERITKACNNCGSPVTRLKSADAPRFYCNHKCYSSSAHRAETVRKSNEARYPNSRVSLLCQHCGESFSRPLSKTQEAKFCSNKCKNGNRLAEGRKFKNAGGYVIMGVPVGHPGARPNGNGSAQIFEHRKVMQEMIGRELFPEENVHHINGVRDDNRPENLELWSKSQPCGQRVKDKLDWARHIIELYGDMP